jgi:pectate lyase
MVLTSDAAFGFGQGVTGGARRIEDQGISGPGREQEKQIIVHNPQDLRRTLAALASPGTKKTVVLLAAGNYNLGGEELTIGASNLTFQPLTTDPVTLKNLSLKLDLASIDNILIRGLAFHSDGNRPNDGILFDGTNSTSGMTNRVRITHCTFDGYQDEPIEIRSYRSLLLATIDHCYFFDNNPGRGDKFYNRGAINIASVIVQKGKNAVRTSANSYVTVAYNYFENVWRRSPRAAADGSHAHVFNNLLYRWGYQQDGVTNRPSWGGIPTELDPHQENQAPVTAVIQANRFIPWADKQSKAIDSDAGTQVDIGTSTSLSNRFDTPNGTSGNTALKPSGPFQTIDVNAWYTGLKGPDGVSLGLQAPDVMATGSVDWVTLARNAGTFVRANNSIPSEVSTDPGK